MQTPRLTHHARERCAEMGISTKVAKRIIQNPSLTRTSDYGPEYRIVESDIEPDYAVVWVPERNRVVTVIFNERRFLARNGTTCHREPDEPIEVIEV